MNAGSVCKGGVMTVASNDDLIAAAHLMREKHVGYLIVSERSGPPERIADPLSNIAGSIRNEQRLERAVRQ